MKNKLIGILLFLISSSVFAQNNTFKFTYMGNDIEVKMERNDMDQFDVYVTNLIKDSDSDSKKFTLPGDATVSSFIETVYGKLDGLIENYKFTVADDVAFVLPKANDSIKYDKFIERLKKMSIEEFQKVVKTKAKYAKNKIKFFKFISNIPEGGTDSLFVKNKLFVFKSIKDDENDSVTIQLTKEGSPEIINISDEETFYKDFYEKEKTNDALMKLLLTADEHATMISTNLKANDRSNLEDFYKKCIGKEEYKFIKNVSVSATDATSAKDYEISVKPNLDDKYFFVKVCNVSPLECKVTQKYGLDIEYPDFKILFSNFMAKNHSEVRFSEYDYRTIYDHCKKFNKEAVAKEVSKEFNDTISSLLKRIEDLEPQYSGILKLNKTPVGVYDDKKDTRKEGCVFVPDYAAVRFFNNKAKDIILVGTLKGKDVSNREFVVRNIRHSIPLRAFINSTQYVRISPDDNDAQGRYINYNDLFHYYPSERTFNFSARNNDYRIKAGDSVKIEQRRLTDYFTAVIFSDFLGLNSENANSLILAEGRLKVPLWISNVSIWSAASALRADINATIYNGFDDSSRFMTPANAPNGVSPTELSSLEVNIFDYIKFNNVNAGIGLDLVNMEIKPLSSELSLGYGVRYYRTGARYTIQKTDADEEKKYQLNALTHELSANFEIRPELNFGADLNLGLNWIRARGSLKDIPITYTQDDKSLLRVQLNLYSKLDPRNSNDGIYARLGGFYHFGSKDFYPQIMVGYATNLSSFVNKFKKG